jgi:hypothetical protein
VGLETEKNGGADVRARRPTKPKTGAMVLSESRCRGAANARVSRPERTASSTPVPGDGRPSKNSPPPQLSRHGVDRVPRRARAPSIQIDGLLSPLAMTRRGGRRWPLAQTVPACGSRSQGLPLLSIVPASDIPASRVLSLHEIDYCANSRQPLNRQQRSRMIWMAYAVPKNP